MHWLRLTPTFGLLVLTPDDAAQLQVELADVERTGRQRLLALDVALGVATETFARGKAPTS